VKQYQNFSVRYRPKVLKQVVGQKSVVTRLRGMFKTKKIPHTILFQGLTGSGKTTLARLIARYVNCSEPKKNGDPCGKCKSCEYPIENHPDYREMNMAESRGIDDIRNIIKSTRYSAQHKFRIMVLDEIHQLTPQAREAMLKPLEEPYPGIIWVLCTTNPEKIPETIRNRCVKFEITQVEPEEVVELLSAVSEKEGIDLDEKPLLKIANMCKAIPRDSLQALESVGAYISGLSSKKKKATKIEKLIPDIIKDVISLPPQVMVAQWLLSVYKGQYTSALKIIQNVPNPEYFCKELVNIHTEVMFDLINSDKLCHRQFYTQALRLIKAKVKLKDEDLEFMSYMTKQMVTTSGEIKNYLVDGSHLLVSLTVDLVRKRKM